MKKIIAIFLLLSMKNFYVLAMDADQKNKTALASSSSDTVQSPSGIASPSSFTELVLQKHIDTLGKQQPLFDTTKRKMGLLGEMKALARNPATQQYALQYALSLRAAEKGLFETYDRDSFKKVEFWAADSQILKIATFWTLHNIQFLKCLNNLNNYEASALSLRKAADKEQWSREKLIEHMTLGWEIMYKLDQARLEREAHDPSMVLSQEVIAAALAADQNKNKRGSGTFSMRKFRSGSFSNSGSNSPSGSLTPKNQ